MASAASSDNRHGNNEKLFGLIAKDEAVFIISHAISFMSAIIFHELKNRQLLTKRSLHTLATALGIIMITIIFGSNIFYMLLQVLMAWLVLIKINNSKLAAALILINSMGVLCYLQIKRLYSAELSIVDFTAPVMISTQKLTSLAFNLRDSRLVEKGRPVPDENRKFMVQQKPSLLQLFSYVFFFHGAIVGPMSFYKDYVHYMESLPPNFKMAGRKRALTRHLLLTLTLSIIMLLIVPKYKPEMLIDRQLFTKWSYPKRILMSYLIMMAARIKYYFAWNLGSCLQLTAGYGYNEEKSDWKGIKNVSMWKLETATSPKAYIDAWNTATNTWLRILAHSRLPIALQMPGTFALSAMWHGFYTGYYFTFIFAIPIVATARRIRRLLRPLAVAKGLLPAYHCLTWICTHFIVAYTVVPFTLLQYEKCIIYYSECVHWSGHIIIMLALIVSHLIPISARAETDGKKRD